MSARTTIQGDTQPFAAPRAAGVVVVIAVLCAACEQQQPRSIYDFMDDAIARDGVLARCDQDRDAAMADIECTNARRAAAAVAVEEERVRSAELALQSERKLAALREREAIRQEAELRAAAEAQAAAQAAYEAQWRDPQTQQPQQSAPSLELAVDGSTANPTE